MNAWASFPFFRYVLWFIAGILARMYLPVQLPETNFLVPAGLSGFILVFLLRQRLSHFNLWQGLFAFLLLFGLGFGRTQQRQEALEPPVADAAGAHFWLVQARQSGEATPKTVKVPVQLLAYKAQKEWVEVETKLMLYIRKDSLERMPHMGDRLLVKMELNEIPAPLNPAAFNYKEYMASQGFCCQAFVRPAQLQLVGQEKGGLRAKALQVRQWASRQLARHLAGEQEEAIANALVLGYREQLDQEITRAYSTAGVMHVLAVSGLHVGFLYLFLQLLFRPWRRHAYLKWVGYGLSLLVLWGYAFVTGLSPSVLRAVIMFSLIAFAVQLKRKSSIYNTLSIAAFAMLLYDPFMLRMVGFQLSFLAVAGIVYLQPRFAAWYKGESRILQKVWGLLAVSLAAQLATFPLGLYYFGQFPTYFFLANLVVVPAASLMLGCGFLFLFVSLFSESMASFFAMLLEGLIWLVNQGVLLAQGLPFSSLHTYIGFLQLCFLIAFLLAVILLFHFRKFNWFVVAIASGLLLLGTFLHDSFRQKRQQKLVLYQVPGYSVLQLVEGRQVYLHAATEIPSQPLEYNVGPNQLAMGLLSGNVLQPERIFKPATSFVAGAEVMVWRGLSIAYISKPLSGACFRQPLEVDYVILAGNAVKDLEVLRCYFKPAKLLIDGSNQNYVQKKLQQQAESLNLPCHLTAEAGAFELNL